MRTVVIIPARFASTRFPGKALAPLKGATGEARSLVRRVWDAAQLVQGVDGVFVAHDDDRIDTEVKSFGGVSVRTPVTCRNGTERCAAALAALDIAPEIVVNIQGDAPLTPPWFVEALIDALEQDPNAIMATPALRCDGATRAALLEDRRQGRVGGTTVVFDRDLRALYFTKEVVPFSGEAYAPDASTPVFHHVGVYAYRAAALAAYQTWPEGTLEALEGLEQLRFLENGASIKIVEVDARGRVFWELNNPEDTPRIEAALRAMNTV